VTRFDSLVHVTRTGRWLDDRHDASYARLMLELDRAAVAKACLVGLPDVADNQYVLECANRSNGRLVPIAGIDPSRCAHDHAVRAEVAAVADAGFAGIKLHPRLNGYDPVGAACLASIRAASEHRLIVFLDTLFRQRPHTVDHAADIADRIAHECAGAKIVLLHGGGAALLELAEVVRLHPALVLDLSFTLLHYAGSSLDADIRWVMRRLDERIVIGSDMPEFTPTDAFARAEQLAEGLPAGKWANIACGNLARLFPDQSPLATTGSNAESAKDAQKDAGVGYRSRS
jgi:predicted TIM-barrel fold metal-dependent hydrolase